MFFQEVAVSTIIFSDFNRGCSGKLVYALLIALALGACSDNNKPWRGDGDQPEVSYSALIERTQYGTAHITADDWGSLGFGQGYAFAQDRFCILMDQIVKVSSRRARYFGPGDERQNIETDFAYLALEVLAKASGMIASLSEEGRDMLQGYVAGYNQYLAETGVDNLPAECAGQPWVQPIDADSLMAFYLDLAMLAGSRNFLDAIASAAPPGAAITSAVGAGIPGSFGAASNGVALGADMTSNGRGLLLANPHLPWEDELKFNGVHLTIPGQLDVAGASLSGAIGVQIGFNTSMAWTHTTSPSNQFIIYTLELVEGQPTRYRYGDEERDMLASDYVIEVLQPDGSLAEQRRTLYSSHYGPMLNPSAFGLAWTENAAYSIFDINADNGAFVDTFLAETRAESVLELREVYRNIGGVVWNHTMATDSTGQTFYADATLVPNLSDAGEAAFRNLIESDELSFTKLAFNAGVVAVNGSDPLFSIDVDDSATLPGMIPFSEAPQLLRRDFVANANDSYWLSNPAEPLTNSSLRYGNSESPRTLRTRLGLTQVMESSSWDRVGIENLLFANRSLTNELWRNEFTSYCAQFSLADSSTGQQVNIEQACSLLSNWDGRYNLESHGAILFRELMSTVDSKGLIDGNSYFTETFDVLNPVATPSGLSSEGQALLLTQLADAVLRLEQIGIPLDAPLGEYQYTLKGNEKISIHGGLQTADGAYNIMKYENYSNLNTTLLPDIPRSEVVNESTNLTTDGYLINYGGSFMMAVEFTEDGPVADALLGYSQSDDPDSPHFADQTYLYSNKTWRPLPFSRAQIEADPALTSQRVDNQGTSEQ